MANPAEWLRKNRVAVAAVAGIGVVGYAVMRNRTPTIATPAPSDAAAGAAGTTDVAGLIGQGAALALQGAGLGLPLAQGGLDLAGQVVGTLGGVASTLAGSQADVAGQAAAVSTAALATITPSPPAPAPAPAPAPTAPAPTPTPTPAPAPAPTVTGYTVHVPGGTLRAYIVGSSCALSVRNVTFSRPSSAPVARGVCNGRVYWRTLAGGYSGVSYVAGLTGGSWYVTRDYSNGTHVSVGQTGS